MKRRRAWETLLAAVVLDAIAGVAFALVEHLPIGTGLYWAVATATTVGYGDVIPRGTGARAIAVVVMLTVVPLFAATFSLLTSGLTVAHIDRQGGRVLSRLDHIIHHHPAIPELGGQTPIDQ